MVLHKSLAIYSSFNQLNQGGSPSLIFFLSFFFWFAMSNFDLPIDETLKAAQNKSFYWKMKCFPFGSPSTLSATQTLNHVGLGRQQKKHLITQTTIHSFHHSNFLFLSSSSILKTIQSLQLNIGLLLCCFLQPTQQAKSFFYCDIFLS